MNTFQQLNPPLPMTTPLGDALAYFIWAEDRLVWYGCFHYETGENWWWLNNYIRMCPSMSDEQHKISPITIPKDMRDKLAKHLKRYPNAKFVVQGGKADN